MSISFNHHRPDPGTPLEETMGALDQVVRQGKALYVGISNYRPADTQRAARILRELGTPCLIHQPNYNMFDRWIEDGLTEVLAEEEIGGIVYSPLVQMAIAWVLRDPVVNSALIGASKVSQIEQIVAGLDNLAFSEDELQQIEMVLGG